MADSLIETIGADLRIQAIVGGEEEARPTRREAGAAPAPAAPEPAAQPSPAEPPPPTEVEVSADDAVLDGSHNAEELLSSAFGAEIISVRDVDDAQS